MDQVVTNHRSSFWQPKRTVLLASAVFSVLIGPLIILADENMIPTRSIRYVLMIGIALLVLAWCYFDAYERHKPFYPWLRIIILLFGVFALLIYLFKSRGLKNGARSAGLAILFCVAMTVIAFASALVFAAIFGVE